MREIKDMAIYSPLLTLSIIGGDGKRGYNLYSIPASLCKVVREHKNRQQGEEIVLQTINSQELCFFKELCLFDEGKR